MEHEWEGILHLLELHMCQIYATSMTAWMFTITSSANSFNKIIVCSIRQREICLGYIKVNVELFLVVQRLSFTSCLDAGNGTH